MKSKLQFISLLAMFWLLMGCSVLPIGQQEDPCVSETALFRDDFVDQECGWAVFGGSESAEITDNVLQIATGSNGVMAWSNPGREFEDTVMTVQTRQVSGPNNNAYGAICRYQDTENFYIFLISGDGYYAIGKYQSGISQVQYLTGSDPDYFVASDAINQGVATNQLRISCIGDQLSLIANGIPLVSVIDSTFSTGDVGVAAATLEPGRVVIEFDNVQVTAP